MTIFTPLTQSSVVWTFAFTRVARRIHLYPTPLFDTIRNSFRIRIIQEWPTKFFAALAALEIHSRIVFCSRIHSYSDCNFLARPSIRATGRVVAYEPTHDVRVVLFGTNFSINPMKVETEIIFFQQARYIIVK